MLFIMGIERCIDEAVIIFPSSSDDVIKTYGAVFMSPFMVACGQGDKRLLVQRDGGVD